MSRPLPLSELPDDESLNPFRYWLEWAYYRLGEGQIGLAVQQCGFAAEEATTPEQREEAANLRILIELSRG